MSITVVVKMKVGNRAKFEEVFDSRASARATAGLEINTYRDIDDPNGIVGIGTGPSKEAFFEFMTTPEQQEAMKNATIQGPPDITFLEG